MIFLQLLINERWIHLMVFSPSKFNFNPHPFIPSPMLGGGEESEKQGFTSGFGLRFPLFFRKYLLR
jgi:hypothetical protein